MGQRIYAGRVLALLAATLIWSFSFVVIKDHLAGVPNELVALYRLVIAALIFAPFAWRMRRVDAFRFSSRSEMPRRRLMLLGAVQFGVMYSLYHASYLTLEAWEVALYTVTTPFWVLALDRVADHMFGRPRRRGAGRTRHGLAWLSVLICILGAGLTRMKPGQSWDLGEGFLLVQAANSCFALGQVAYRRMGRGRKDTPNAAAHFWMYCGAVAFSLVGAAWRVPFGEWLRLAPQEFFALLYLGVVASGVGFFLWNSGARLVQPPVLASVNNLKVPSGVLVSLLFSAAVLPSGIAWIGIVLVLISIALSARATT